MKALEFLEKVQKEITFEEENEMAAALNFFSDRVKAGLTQY